jgi:hypothetical protein
MQQQEQPHIYNYNSDPQHQQFLFQQQHNHPPQQHHYHHFQSSHQPPLQQQQQQQQQQPTIPCLIVPQRTESPSPSKIIRSGLQRFGRHDSLRRSTGEKNINNNNLISSSIKRPNSTTPTNKNSMRGNVKNPRIGFAGMAASSDTNLDTASNGRKKLVFSNNTRPHPRN